MTKVKCVCRRCGKEFYKIPSKIKEGRGKYCSNDCRKNQVERICTVCKKVFFLKQSVIKSGKGRFCSRKCYNKSRIGKKKNVKIRKLIIEDEYALIPLTCNRFAIIDLEDVEKVKNYNWSACAGNSTYYVSRKESLGRSKILLHRFLLGLNKNDGMMVDHISGDGLDNRRSNLRICLPFQNNVNRCKMRCKKTSKYKGIYFRNALKKFVVSINYKKKSIYLGLFDDETEAAKAYDKKAIELHKEFARTNFPKENYI